MSATRVRQRSRSRRPEVLQKPAGVIHPRVRKVGPEHFGVVSVDCAKARSKWMLCDFFGNVLIPPIVVEHNCADLESAVERLREAKQEYALHDVIVAVERTGRYHHSLESAVERLREAKQEYALHDVIVAVERTGRYHHSVRQAFAAAGFEVRIVHPFTTKRYRQVSDPGNKTDDTDLAAIQRAAVNGFALLERPVELSWRELQLLIRHRRDLVFKSSAVATQIREHLEAALPGYAACFDKLWESTLAWTCVRHFESARAIHEAGMLKLIDLLQREKVRFQRPTVERVRAWAARAAASDQAATMHRRIALALHDDHRRKTQEILERERDIAGYLTQTPYVLRLSFPGINVVSAADFAGEMGPIGNYANSRCITGRAGLCPSRHQSDQVDLKNGPLRRCANRKLRAAVLGIADNLILCNHHFNALAAKWRAAGKDPRHTHVKVAARFCRIAYQMVAGGQVFRHPALQQRHYILDKLRAFHREHNTPIPQTLRDVEAAVGQIPSSAHADEAKPLAAELLRIHAGRRQGPQLLGDISPMVLARLGVAALQSGESGERDST